MGLKNPRIPPGPCASEDLNQRVVKGSRGRIVRGGKLLHSTRRPPSEEGNRGYTRKKRRKGACALLNPVRRAVAVETRDEKRETGRGQGRGQIKKELGPLTRPAGIHPQQNTTKEKKNQRRRQPKPPRTEPTKQETKRKKSEEPHAPTTTPHKQIAPQEGKKKNSTRTPRQPTHPQPKTATTKKNSPKTPLRGIYYTTMRILRLDLHISNRK